MNRFTRFSLKNTVVIFLAIIMVIVGGIYSTGSIKEEAMPNISIPVITTSTLYVGAAPEDVAEKVSRPIQKSISGIQGIKDVRTISNENISFVVAEFDYSTDMDKAEKEVQDAVNNVTLPDSVQKPVVSKISLGGFPILQYSIESSMGAQDLTKFVDEKLQPELSGIAGVSSADVQGTSDKKIYIKLDSSKLQENNIQASDIQKTLQSNNINIPAGQINVGDISMPVKISSQILTINDIKSIPFIVMPNQNQIIGESMGKAMEGVGQLGQAVGQIGQTVGQLGQAVGNVGQGMQQMGSLVGTNTQAIAMLNMIQKSEAAILAQQAVLSNPASSPEEKGKAGEAIKQAQAMMQGAQQALDNIIGELSKAKGSSTSGQTAQNKVSMPNGNLQKTSSVKSSQPASGKISTGSSSKLGIKIVFLKDIATVTEGNEDAAFYTRSNLKDGMILSIYKNDDANTVSVSNDVKKALDELSKSNSNVKFNIINDSSDTIKASVNGMMREGLLGALFAVVVIALFLRDMRSTIIAVISIPLSILIALILLPRFNITLNIMSLGGIAVAIGRIVDDSIVVIENIYRRVQKGDIDGEQLIESAAGEVSSAITSSTITTVAVFLPLTFVSGIIGKVFIPFAVTVVTCILASLLVAVTVVPVMCKLMLLNKNKKHVHRESRIINFYNRILNSALKHKAIVLIVSFVLLISSFGLISRVGVQFMPSDTTAVLTGKLNLEAGTSLAKTNEEALKFEKYLVANENVKTVVSSVGDTSGASGKKMSLQGSNQASFTIVLKDGINYDAAANEIINKTREFNKNGESLMIQSQSTTGQKDNFQVIVNGNSYKDIEAASLRITKELGTIKQLSNISNSLSEKKKEVSVEIDNDKAAQKGLTPIMVAGIVRGMMTDTTVMTLSNGGKDVDVEMGYKDSDLNTLDKLQNMEINLMGNSIKLKDIANIKEEYGPVSIQELDGNQYASITADINGKDTQRVSKEAFSKIDSIKNELPSGVTYSQGGSTKDIQQGFSQMGMAMLIAVLMVYVVMVLAFGEATAPFAILFSLPFAGVGAILALFIANQPLTMSGLIGMLMLIGIVVTNAIVLLDRVQSNRKKGMSINEALIEAGSVRLRPIFMTAIATVMALMPLALGFSEGTVISQGLGIVVIGGLTLSTVLTHIIVPVMYSVFEGFKEKRVNRTKEEIV